MKFLTFDQIKAQLRLDDVQATEEHDLLESYGEAAEDMVLNTCNRTITDIFEQYGMVPKALVQAGLMLVAQSYMHREPASPQNLSVVPYAFDLLLKPYIKLTT
jgi:glutamyl-tRNA reductase